MSAVAPHSRAGAQPARAWLSHLLVVLAGALVLAGCGSDPYADDPDVVAAFEGGAILRSEFDAFERLTPQIDDPQVTEVEETDWRRRKIDDIVVRRFLELEAPQPGGGDPDFDMQLEKAKIEILRVFMSAEVGFDRVPVTSQQIRAHYDDNPDLYNDPRKLRLQHIYLRAEQGVVPEDERLKVRARMEEIRQEVIDGADMTEMARLYSQSSTAGSGGYMTLSKEDRIYPPFVEAAYALEINELTPVIDTPTGYQVAKLVEIFPPIARKFEDNIEFARGMVLKENLRAAHEAFMVEAGPAHGMGRDYSKLENPEVALDEPLIWFDGGEAYTFGDLSDELPVIQRGQLYNFWFDQVYEFLDTVAVNRLLVLEAERRNFTETPGVASSIEQATRELQYEWALRKRMLVKAEAVDDETLREYFDQNAARYQTLRTRDVDAFFLRPLPGENLWDTKKRAERFHARILAGEDFATIAKQHSDHFSKNEGGRLENLTDYGIFSFLMPKARFGRLFNALSEGEMTEPIVSECYDGVGLRYLQTGAIFARLVKEHPPRQQTFESAVEGVRANYMRRNYAQMEAEVIEEVLRAAKIRIYADRLPPI